MDYYIHPLADVQSTTIGRGTRIWQFVVILAKAVIGEQCNICSHCFLENDVIVGDRVTLKNGVQLWDGIRVDNDVFIGPNVSFTNDKFPRSRVYPDRFQETKIEEFASLGAGAVVTRSVPSCAIVKGNPARVIGYVDEAQG